MPRPVQYDRSDVLHRAMELFWDRGYEATSLADVLRATGFNRHSLYAEFGGKDGLYLEALRAYAANFDATVAPALAAGGLEAVRAVFDLRMPHDLAGRGCLMTNTLSERAHVVEEACGLARAFNERLRQALQAAIERAQAAGEVAAHRDAAALARYVVVVLQGLGAVSRAGLARADAEATRELTLDFLRSAG